ncbi:uncharacterized protein EI90DRAFT_3118004 [Cantharellus anzutake]|uniref:uncharacterized protein n=1 Tax=Cantharellus anzutake TaxID=1750568 RepID=UPI0019073A6C|nr:uncharacterized protein EI90DRAFT_3118004 [Cantharellus anzutake]KAF8338933.1 hypothetical protein EI90DRAFT_3118004 [Cantharellus anzutake]
MFSRLKLSHQISILKPQVEELNRKEERRKRLAAQKSNGVPAGLGSAQLRSIQRRLAQETSMLDAARAQADYLTKRLQMHDVV